MSVGTKTAENTSMEHSIGGVWRSEPSLREILLLWLVSFCLFVGFVAFLRNYFNLVDNFGDGSAYMSLASAIRHWDFRGVVIKQFWGLPYAMAALSRLTGASDRTAMLIISIVSSVAAAGIAYRLWGGWIAGFFAILSFDWLQRSYLGGSEPLFVALLFGAFWAVRRERWAVASLLASCATVVRPLGIFPLIGIGLVLLWRRDYRRFAAATAIGIAVGVLYMLPLARHFGDPLATVNSYHSAEWQGGWLFGFPFYAIIKGTLTEPAPLSNLILSFGWIFLVLAAVVVMIRDERFREYGRTHPVEILFLIPYVWCLYTYNYPHWARKLPAICHSRPAVCLSGIDAMAAEGPACSMGVGNSGFPAGCSISTRCQQRARFAAPRDRVGVANQGRAGLRKVREPMQLDR